MLPPYAPEPYVNFSEPGPRDKMLAALQRVKGELGRTYPLWIAGEAITPKETFTSTSPADPDRVVGVIAKANADLADRAVKTAAEAFQTWSRVDPDARARILIKAAAIMRRRIYELSAWMVYEESKSWIEAYADACETIDFLEFYGREMMRLKGAHPVTPYPGEENEVRYLPLGVGVVIPPWNFPLAICTGMTSAALVTGNTVVLKPASTAPVVAAKMVECLHQAGLPKEVLNFVPGPGGSVGDTAVCHPLTRFISFTGSREVGCGIFEKAAKVQPGQIWLKRTVLEMGGKDCIVVDETADVAAAAEGVVAAAFGFQGQKCSACSRLIAQESVYQKLLDDVVARAKTLTIGDTTGPENYYLGAVIDAKAHKNINEYIKIGKGEGRAVLADGKVPAKGYFVPPTIIADVAPNARVAQEEIFGPVLAVIKFKTFDEGLQIANGTQFGLTGALYSNDRMRLERARYEFHVGNLYLNRKCTGALVDVQPFGGFNMSGTDSKAGGRDYLQLFLQGKSIAERL
ncbi:MAG TPA: L-glutamate gamma-semialdehyde dehydrogenase [Phycisphaerae bacterium]|nr:L-glutamate gamma-semialdehyde dehydrogenase [Phycisphaerae bacterium]HNU45722.1 L-glutamate gamma-semialdehyde dehydrogenase [Phycisphaerae bacterium]